MLFLSSDTGTMVPKYIAEFWYLTMLWIVLLACMICWFPRKVDKQLMFPIVISRLKLLPIPLAIILFCTGFVVSRGLEPKPIRLITANKYVAPGYIPLVINTPFTILNSINQYTESLSSYFPSEEAEHYFQPVRTLRTGDEFRKQNVVIIILESFGKEYVETISDDGESYTPFLDSLLDVGLNCTRAFANGRTSMDAMPAIVGGFPSLLNTSYIASIYSVNNIRGLAFLLKQKGYSTSFYHGAKNGSMGFDLFTKAAGIDEYYGRSEFKDDKYYDGAWGIWDEHFFQYMANNLDRTAEPFFSVLFTLSSHEPYNIPESLNTVLPEGPQVLRAVAYTDYALQSFFHTASKMPWYTNTLFVLLADHTSVAISKDYKSPFRSVQIPILYYAPGDPELHGEYTKVTQQLDVMPSVLDYLNFSETFTSFGNSIFSEKNEYRFSVNYDHTSYQMIDSAYCMRFDGTQPVFLSNHTSDPLLSVNILDQDREYAKQMEVHLKAFLQNYYVRLNTNKLGDTLSLSGF